MTDRIKLTEDDFSPVSDYLIYLNGNDETIKQILENQEIREKYDDLMKANSEIVQNNISHTKIFQENKQLKEEIERINDKLGNELQVKYLEIEGLKQKLSKIGELIMSTDWYKDTVKRR